MPSARLCIILNAAPQPEQFALICSSRQETTAATDEYMKPSQCLLRGHHRDLDLNQNNSEEDQRKKPASAIFAFSSHRDNTQEIEIKPPLGAHNDQSNQQIDDSGFWYQKGKWNNEIQF